MVMLQGNTYWLAVRVEDCEGKVVGGDRVAKGRFEVGGIVKYYGEGGEVVWDEQVGAFLFPLSEEETFTLSGAIGYQARVVLEDGTVCGSVPEEYYVYESLSKELIGDGGYGTQNGVVLSAKLVNYVQAGGSGGGTSDYEKLENKPSINGVELKGNKTTEELGIVSKESDPTVPSHVKAIKESDIENWDGKVGQSQLEETNNNIILLAQNKADVSYVDEKISKLVGSAPELLDTLEELAGAINENQSVIGGLDEIINGKADKSELAGCVKYGDHASNEEVAGKAVNNKYLSPENVDKIIRVGLTTNAETLTDEEKTQAQNWLGITELVGDINTILEDIVGV